MDNYLVIVSLTEGAEEDAPEEERLKYPTIEKVNVNRVFQLLTNYRESKRFYIEVYEVGRKVVDW